MTKTNLQVRIPAEVDSQIAKLALGSKSAFIRRAIEEKVHRELDQRLEEQWIKALKKNPEEEDVETQSWLKGESWGPR